MDNQERKLLPRCKPGLKTCCWVPELLSPVLTWVIQRCVCFAAPACVLSPSDAPSYRGEVEEKVSVTERAMMDHRAVLKDLLKAPLSFPAQANGFTFNGNVCTILHLMCSLFTCAPDGHPVRGDRAIGIETKQKFALRKHAFPAHFSHTVYWEDWEIHPFCIDSDDFQVLTRVSGKNLLVPTSPIKAALSFIWSTISSLANNLITKLVSFMQTILLVCEGVWSSSLEEHWWFQRLCRHAHNNHLYPRVRTCTKA